MKPGNWVAGLIVLVGVSLNIGIVGCKSPRSTSAATGQVPNFRGNAEEISLATVRNQSLREEVAIRQADLEKLANAMQGKIAAHWFSRTISARDKAYPLPLRKQDLDEEFRIFTRRLDAIRAERAVYDQILRTDGNE